MSRYKYEAIDHNGKSYRGALQAPSLEDATELIAQRGLWIHQLEQDDRWMDKLKKILTKELFGGPRIGRQHFMLFCRQLATLYQAGVPLATAVSTLAEQTDSKPFKKILAEVAHHMNNGFQFSEAVAHFPKVFPTIFISMAEAGEESGKLDVMLNRMAVFYEKEHYTREKIKTALAYPSFLAIMTVVVVIALMIFVIPQFTSNFAEMNMVLPLPTRIVIAVSDVMIQLWYLIPILFVLLGVAIFRFKKHPQGMFYWDSLKLKVPVFGKLWRNQILARFSRTFSSLYVSGVPMLEMLKIVANVVDNEVVRRLIGEARDRLRNGFSMSEPFARHRLFPPMVVQMLILGENSGSLESVMEKIADYYEAEVDSMSDRIKSLLEPIMLLVLAGVVGVIVMAIMLPSFSMINQIQ